MSSLHHSFPVWMAGMKMLLCQTLEHKYYAVMCELDYIESTKIWSIIWNQRPFSFHPRLHFIMILVSYNKSIQLSISGDDEVNLQKESRKAYLYFIFRRWSSSLHAVLLQIPIVQTFWTSTFERLGTCKLIMKVGGSPMDCIPGSHSQIWIDQSPKRL